MTYPNNDGGSAFPGGVSTYPNDQGAPTQFGMTLRDYFAAKVLPALISQTWKDEFPDSMDADKRAEVLSIAAYCYADEMLKARKEES